MVFMLIDRQFQAFGNVRLAEAPVDAGHLGELRLTNWNHLQHRAYKRRDPALNNRPHEFSVPVGMVDELATRQFGCDLRLLTLKGFEHWLRFPTDADATIFFRLLLDRIEAIIDDDGPEWPDSWEGRGRWTLDLARSMPEPSPYCRCHLQNAMVMRLMSRARREEEAARIIDDAQPPASPEEKQEDEEVQVEELEVVEEVDDDDDDDDKDENEVPEEDFVSEGGVDALLRPPQVLFEEDNQLPPPENLSPPRDYVASANHRGRRLEE